MAEHADDFNVFISWSGGTSKKVALAVQDWLCVTVQAATPFVSEKNIDAGDRGLQEIDNQLDKIKVGIICLTSQNLSSSWLHFEAGALSKEFGDKSYVIPLLFDLDSAQVKHPLAQFQWKRFTEEDMASVARTVNKSLGYPVNNDKLTTTLEWNWARLATAIENIRAEASQQVLIEEPKRTTEDMFEEIVVAIREQTSLLNELKKSSQRSSIADRQLDSVNDVLEKLTELHDRTPRRYTVKSLAAMNDHLDAQDWSIIETAPFLAWFLERYFDVSRPKAMDDGSENLNDVPF